MSLHTGIPITGYTEVELGDGSITLMGTGEKHGIHGVVGPHDTEPLLAPKDLIMINVAKKVPLDDEKELLFPNLDIPKPVGRVCIKYMRPIDVAKAMDQVVAASDSHEKDRLREILMKGSYATHKNDVGKVDPKYTHTIRGRVPERQAIRMDEISTQKTAFTWNRVSYGWTVLPQGYKNSPNVFQGVMEDILKGLEVTMYIDGVLHE